MAAGITLCGSLSRWASPLGAAMHNAGYRELGLDWHYVPFAVHAIEPAIAAMRTLGIRGLGIAVPFKQTIMPLLDTLSPLAERIGAVNTVVNDDGELVGHNTDWVGATRALEEAVSLRGTRVLVLGAGGAARAVVYGLAHAGANVAVSNRSDERGRALAEEADVALVPWAARAEASWDVLVNATSAGMRQDDGESPCPWPSDTPMTGSVVMDIVYKPLATELLRRAREQGIAAVHGGRMLLHQAARQFELYTEADAPLAAMDAALELAMPPT